MAALALLPLNDLNPPPSVSLSVSLPSTALHTGLAWLHIPKCGTSAAKLFSKVLKNSPCCVDAATGDILVTCIVAEPCKDVNTMKASSLPSYWPKPWSSHDAISNDAAIKFHGRFVGFFRDPLARAVSTLRDFGREATMSQAAALQRTAGTQTRMLSGQAKGTECNSVAALTCQSQPACVNASAFCPANRPPANTTLALTRLARGFAFVGLTDAWPLSVCLFHRMHGGECTIDDLEDAHPTGDPTEPSVNPVFDDEATLYAASARFSDPDDDAIFSAAKDMFCTALRDYDVSHASCRASICPVAAAHLYEVDASEARHGEIASMCPGREGGRVLKFGRRAT